MKVFGCSHNVSDAEFMMGLLNEEGYFLTGEEAELWVIVSCTVKGPSQDAALTLVSKAKALNKKVILAGCVPQAESKLELQDVSLLGVHQVDDVVQVVEETLKGNVVKHLARKLK